VKRVVVVGSDAAWREMRTSVAYCASKAALHQAVRVIARERASEEFAINVVAPGMTEPTGMQEYVDESVPMIRKWR
jgi:2,3-dihydro-2,3-dihydroxybenzoate dehydrogenase